MIQNTCISDNCQHSECPEGSQYCWHCVFAGRDPTVDHWLQHEGDVPLNHIRGWATVYGRLAGERGDRLINHPANPSKVMKCFWYFYWMWHQMSSAQTTPEKRLKIQNILLRAYVNYVDQAAK